jgi:uncharacterized membrane protein YqiK
MAEADAVRARMEAEAAGIERRAAALSQNQEAVIAQQIAENLPAIVQAAASPFEHVGSFTVLNGAEGVTGALAQIIQQAGALSNMARETLMTPTGVNGSANGKAPSGNGAKPSTKAVVPLGETQPRKERQTARSAAAGARAEERGASGEAAH